jgi:hypothetical protein
MDRKPWRGTWNHLLAEADWRDLLNGYQHDLSSDTSTPLLAALEPAARRVCRTLPHVAGCDAEDVWQQFQMALLQEAMRLRMPDEAEAIPFRLLERARRAVSRWIARQRQELALPLSELIASDEDVEVEAIAAVEFSADPIYRRVVDRESLAAQARTRGISAGAMRVRAHRRRKQLRQAL